MPTNLESLLRAVAADPGLRANISASDISGGVAAAVQMNTVLLTMIDAVNANDDGLITAAEMAGISDLLLEPENARPWQQFLFGHGNDNGTVETGFHLVQGDGATLVFQGRNFVDTVADSIYHYGFTVTDGRYVNEDGASNETTADVAGWLNYFLNGENVVFGDAGDDEVGSGEYSEYFAAARNETFLVGNGNDKVWADIGNDKVFGGNGNDRVGAGMGTDRVFGEAGNDTLWGERGADALYGGDGLDTLGGGDDNDRLFGGDGFDEVYGENGNDYLAGGQRADTLEGQSGADTLYGGQGHDRMGGGDWSDRLIGDADNDTMYGGNGTDTLKGGTGADELILWEDVKSRDTLIFAAGDSGKTVATIDVVMGFESGIDRIDLTAFGRMTFQALDFTAGGRASCYFDGRHLRIDGNGDGRLDMMVAIGGNDDLRTADFIFA